jgi:hypothetical protein
MTDQSLEIKKTGKRIIAEKIIKVLHIIVLSLAFTILVHYAKYRAFVINWSFVLILLIAVLALSLFLRKKKNEDFITLLKLGDDVSLNGVILGNAGSINYVIIDEYVSSDTITGICTISLGLDKNKFPVLVGINGRDVKEITELLLGFLSIPGIEVIKNIV